jgi:two-component system OmpR family sensor kinase
MFTSLRGRLFLSYMVVSAIVLLLVAIGLLLFVVRNPLAQRLVFLDWDARLNAEVVLSARRLTVLSTERQQELLQRLDQVAQARVLWVDQSGQVRMDSRPGDPPLPGEIIDRLLTAEGPPEGLVRVGNNWWLYRAFPLQETGWILFSAPRPILRLLNAVVESLLSPFLQAGTVALLLSIGLAYLISRSVSAPLRQISDAAKALSVGDFDHQVQPSGPDEVQSLALAFDEMSRRVEASHQAQRDFVANVSHELKTPLTSIQGFAQALLDGTAGDDEARAKAARIIHEESDRLRRLVDDLLDLARLDAEQVAFMRRPVDLNALIQRVVDGLGVTAREQGVELHGLERHLPPVIGDGDRLAQVLTNLIDNAIKHSSSGGKVRVEGEFDQKWLKIHVRDEGPGIPPDELSRIFERFYQLDKARAGGRDRGAGLGLAISREIIRAHGGELSANSEVGSGSTFTIRLPRVDIDHTQPVQP